MKVQVEEGIPNWLLCSIILACASPAVTLNVWPRLEIMFSGGVSSNSLGIVLLVTLSALGMTCVPFAMKKSENIGFWWTCLLFGIGLGILNYTMAVGAVGKSRDEESGSKKALIERAANLKLALTSAERDRANLPPFKWTTESMVSSANLAVSLANEARIQECAKVGDHCRARVLQLSNRQSDLADVAANRANTERAEHLDRKLSNIRGEIGSLGSIPDSDDQQASRIAAVIGAFIPLGAKASESVATGLIHFLAICAEAFALGMPRIIVTALAKGPRTNDPKSIAEKIDAAIHRVATPSLVATPTEPARVKEKRTPAQPKVASIPEWKALFLMRSQGKIRDWDAFEHYKGFAREAGLAPATFVEFNKELQRLGLRLETDPALKRDFFLDTSLKQPLKAVS